MSSGSSSYVDFHCHLDLYSDPRAAVARTEASRVYTLAVTTTPSAWPGTVRLVATARRVHVGLGLHPEIAHQRIGELSQFEAYLPEARYVGEIGLDGSPQYRGHQAVQARAFSAVLGMAAAAGGRVLSVHSRRAVSAALDILSAHPGAGTPVMHWFTGTKAELARAAALGCWFSVGPGMLRASGGLDRVRAMPIDRMLTETDGPFTRCCKEACGPWDAPSVVAGTAAAIGQPPAEVAGRIADNFMRLCGSASIETVADP